MQRLPILDIVKQSFALPFSRPVEFFKTVGLFFAVTIAASVVTMILGMAIGVPFDEMQTIEQDMANGDFSALFGMIPIILIMMFIMMMLVAYIFNYWVRAGAFGFEHARIQPFGEAMSAAFVNGLKFLLIGILLGIVSFVVISALSAVGLTNSLFEQMGAAVGQDIAAATRAGMLNQIISLVIGAIVYSLFSANLTQTALRSSEEGLSHPHTIDFAVVLMLVYLVVLVPVTILGLMGMMVLTSIVNAVLGVFVMFAIGVAHGIRYRLCRAEEQNTSDTPTE